MTQVEAAEAQLVHALRAGDEGAFAALVREYHGSLVRVARTYVSTLAAAEEVAQETWVGVLNGLDRFEGRSSLRTWIFRILTNIAKTRAQRDRRTVPFASLEDESGGDEASVDPDRWGELPEERLVYAELLARVEEAIAQLPPVQRQVVTLRDVDGWSSEEVCSALGLSETNQRVLLHRARSKVRQALEEYVARP